MNTDGHLYSENEIAGNMMEEYDRKDQQITAEVKKLQKLHFIINL